MFEDLFWPEAPAAASAGTKRSSNSAYRAAPLTWNVAYREMPCLESGGYVLTRYTPTCGIRALQREHFSLDRNA